MLAERPNGDRVAVKRLTGDWASEADLARFRREARILERLHHPHIVGSEGHIVGGGQALLVLEYVDGPNLALALQSSPMSTADALLVLAHLSVALEYAHRQGVLHRDLTPANVLFTMAGQTKLADFGVAKMFGTEHGTSLMTFRTHTGALVGTPVYMSPEACEGTTELTPQSDVYSLGVMAYRLLVGRLPFPYTGDLLAALEAQINQPPPAPASIGVTLPPAVELVVMQALEKQPARRPDSVATFWEGLAAAADEAWPRWRDRADLAAVVARAAPAIPHVPETERASAGDRTVDVDIADPLIREGLVGARPIVAARVAPQVFVPRKRRTWSGLALAGVAGAVVAAILLVWAPWH
jgi:serine/threonine-protein kinase